MQNEQTPAAGPSLLPCPFCGSESVSQDSTACTYAADYIWFKCEGCGVESEGEHGRDAALAQWNRRPHVASPASSSSVVQGDASGVEDLLGRLGFWEMQIGRVAREQMLPSEVPLAEFQSLHLDLGRVLDEIERRATLRPQPTAAPVSRPAGEGEVPTRSDIEQAIENNLRVRVNQDGEEIVVHTERCVDAIIALLSPAAPDAGGGEDLAGKLKAIRDKFLMATPDKDHTDYAVMTRCIAALQPGGER